MMSDQFFAYDASIVAPLSRVPVWPYTLHHLMPHKCHGNKENCPSRAHQVWELPINELDRRYVRGQAGGLLRLVCEGSPAALSICPLPRADSGKWSNGGE